VHDPSLNNWLEHVYFSVLDWIPAGPTDKRNERSERQPQVAILREDDHSGGTRISEPANFIRASDMTLSRNIERLATNGMRDITTCRKVQEHVGQFILAELFNAEEDDVPRTVKDS
jgi:hypothetical protein